MCILYIFSVFGVKNNEEIKVKLNEFIPTEMKGIKREKHRVQSKINEKENLRKIVFKEKKFHFRFFFFFFCCCLAHNSQNHIIK